MRRVLPVLMVALFVVLGACGCLAIGTPPGAFVNFNIIDGPLPLPPGSGGISGQGEGTLDDGRRLLVSSPADKRI